MNTLIKHPAGCTVQSESSPAFDFGACFDNEAESRLYIDGRDFGAIELHRLIEGTGRLLLGVTFTLKTSPEPAAPVEMGENLICTVERRADGVIATVTTEYGHKAVFEGRIHPPVH